MLLDAARQVATFVNTCTTTVMEQQTKFTTEAATFLTEAIVKGRENGQEQMLEIARQLHDNATRTMEAVATRLEAVEERLLAIEKHLGGKPAPRTSGAVDDAGGGP
jgi:flagellar biosynthesis/type III secretory pathway protein FliH